MVSHYPTNVKCYTGYVVKRKPGRKKFLAGIRSSGIKMNKSFYTEEEAFEHLKSKNIEFNLPIANKVYDCGEYYEIDLTKGKKTKIDKDDLARFQIHIWHTTEHRANVFYSGCVIDNHLVRLHNYIMNHTPTEITVDHINGDGLDNRKSNLRLATKTEQAFNRRMQSNNKTGTINISYEHKIERYKANWIEHNVKKSKSFSVKKWGVNAKQLAIDYLTEKTNHLNLGDGATIPIQRVNNPI